MFGMSGDFPSSRVRPVWVAVCVAAVLGPYLVSGLRTEQLAFYGSAAFVVLTQRSALVRTLAPARWILAVWAAYALVAVAGGLLPVGNGTPWESGSLIAGLDNALLPLATIVTVCHWCRLWSGEAVLSTAGRVLVVAMSLNAAVAFAGSLVGLAAMPWLRQFWAADGTSTFVAELAEQMGRYSGVFNQPAEAGIAYTLALLSLAYLQKQELVRPVWAYVAWAAIVVGGLLTLSKVFVGGLVLALLVVLVYRTRVLLTAAVALGTTSVMVALTAAGWFSAWGASTMAGWYRYSIEVGDSPLYTLTAGRFGTPGTDGPPSIAVPMAPSADGATGAGGADAAEVVLPPAGTGELVRTMVQEHPFFGVGARGLQVAYDSAWSEAVVVGGLTGLGLVLLAHLLLVVSAVTGFRRMDRAHAVLLSAVVVLTLAGSMGLPALTGNRESTLLWIWLVVLGFAGRFRSQDPHPGTGEQAVLPEPVAVPGKHPE